MASRQLVDRAERTAVTRPYVLLTRIVIPLAVAGAALALPAQASTGRPSTGNTQVATRNLIAPLSVPGPRTTAQTLTAAATCASYATRAGWANNGYYGGDLVTAAAICVAESAGSASLYVCDDNGAVVGQGHFPPAVKCPPQTTYDRGLWQLNSKAAAGVSDACAFSPLCNAEHAYLASNRGTSFTPWSSYDQDTYARPYLDVVQAVVTKLSAGTVTGALLGECLAQSKSAVGARVILANCGSGSVNLQQWATGGGKLRSGSVCAAIASGARNADIVLRRCARGRSQDWLPYSRAELRNAADGLCITVPRGSKLSVGTPVDMSRCSDAKAQTWWLP
jgi:Ricin-type beta-trefoil lectin domain/Lysozyme like domain